jgi:IS5 family transposase
MIVSQQYHYLSNFEIDKQCIDLISFGKFLDFPEYLQDSTTISHSEKDYG